jgi:DNA-binding transcriptional ArsR family regulator
MEERDESTGDLGGVVAASRHRRLVVEALRDGPKTPTDIAHRTNLHRSSVSRALAKLRSVKIVYCLAPGLRKGRLYGLRPEASVRLRLGGRPEERPTDWGGGSGPSVFEPRVRGEAILAGIAAGADLLGTDAVVHLSRTFGLGFLPFRSEGWYPIQVHHAFLSGLERLFGCGDGEMCRQVGRRSIAYLPHLQRFLARDLGLMAMAERIPLVHSHYFNFGRFRVASVAEGVEIRQIDMMPTPEFCAARRGNYEGVMAATRYAVDVTEARCQAAGDRSCVFRVERVE